MFERKSNADPSMLGKQDAMLPQDTTENEKKDSQFGQHLVKCCGATHDTEWKILDACRTVEELMTIEAIYISKLKPALNSRNEYGRAGVISSIHNFD